MENSLKIINLREPTVEQFASLDTLIMCTQGLYNTRMSEMRTKINELEEMLVWPKLKIISLKRIIKAHNFKTQCKCEKCGWCGLEPEDKICKWKPIFEEIITRHGLTFASGTVKKCLIGITRLKLNETLQAHLCSGPNGDWDIEKEEISEPGFGGLFITNPKDINKYINFVLEIFPPT